MKKSAMKKSKQTIMFVCTGNTCRSAMAENILRHELKRLGRDAEFTVISSGVHADSGTDMPREAKEALDILGIKHKKHSSRITDKKLIKKSALIIAMTDRHKEIIDCPEKCVTVGELTGGGDVSDPFGGSVQSYLKTAENLLYACADIVSCLDKRAKDS